MNISLIGTDSSHFDQFLAILRSKNIKPASILQSPADPKSSLIKEYQLEDVLTSDICHAVSCADLVMIIDRFPYDHLPSLDYSIRSGKHVFVDKPLLASLDQIKSLNRLLSEYPLQRSKIVSFSPLRFSKEVIKLKSIATRNINVYSPLTCNDMGTDPRFRSPLFYGIHGTDIASTLIGGIVRQPLVSSNTITFYGKAGTATVHLVPDITEAYSIQYSDSNGNRQEIDVVLDGSYYQDQVDHLLKWVTYKSQIMPTLSDTIKQVEALITIEKDVSTFS